MRLFAVLQRIYAAWMAFGLALRAVVSPIALALVYFLIFTPIGLLRCLVGSDPLRLRKKAPAQTYWEDRPPPDDAASYLRQY